MAVVGAISTVGIAVAGQVTLTLQPGALANVVPAVDVDAQARETAKSLVLVEYTLRNENISREESGQGIVVSKDGVVLISGGLIPEALPKEYVKDLKIRLPGKNFTTVPAKLLGRTQNRLFAFVKAEKPIEAEVFKVPATGAPALGETVFSAGILGKGSGYSPYAGVTTNKAVLELTYTVVVTQTGGLTRANSPVFDRQTGNLVGITLSGFGGARQVEGEDEQGTTYLPYDEVKDVFQDVPTQPFETRRPWAAVDGMTGLEEEVRELFHITQPAAVAVGSVIPNEAADKAGLKPKDIILTVDGKPFSNSPVPNLAVMHFSRALEKHKPGDEIVLGIVRDRGETKLDVKLKLGTVPKGPGEMQHVFSPRIGIATRDLVFGDAYARKLPQDTKGVVVALVKNGAPASLGQTPLHANHLIIKVDDQPVEDQKQFLELMKKEEEKADLKEMVFVVINPDGQTGVCRIDLSK